MQVNRFMRNGMLELPKTYNSIRDREYPFLYSRGMIV